MSHSSYDSVAIFWDYENCHAPMECSGYELASNIRLAASKFGSIKLFKAYLEITDQSSSRKAMTLRSELQSSGVSLTDCPHNGRKDVADKMILVDMLAYAIDTRPPATIFLISGDRDFAYAISILRQRQYQVVLVSLPGAHISLTAQATVCLDWNQDVMNAVRAAPQATPAKAVKDDSSSQDSRPDSRNLSIGSSTTLEAPYPLSLSSRINPTRLANEAGFPNEYQTSSGPELSAIRTRDESAADPFLNRRHGASLSSESFRTFLPAIPRAASEYSSSQPDVNSRNSIDQEYSPTSNMRQERSEFSPPLPAQLTLSQSPLKRDSSVPVKTKQAISDTPFSKEPSTASTGLPHLQTRTKEPSSEYISNTNSDGFRSGNFYGDASSVISSHPANGFKPIPEHFRILHERLLYHHQQGFPRPLRSDVALWIASNHRQVYEGAGVDRFFQYIQLAESAGMVITGGMGLSAWVGLAPGWVDAIAGSVREDDIGNAFKEEPSKSTLHRKYLPLVELLRGHIANNVPQPLRSKVGYELVTRHGSKFYENVAGVAGFSAYAAMAEKDQVITLGGTDGFAWMALRPEWIKATAEEQADKNGGTFKTPQAKAETPTNLPSTSTQKPTPNAHQHFEGGAGGVSVRVIRVAEKYRTLLETLGEYHDHGIPCPRRSLVASIIVKKDPEIYRRAGADKFGQYSTMAADDKIIVLGGDGGDAWIKLHPDLAGKDCHWSFVTASDAARSRDSEQPFKATSSTTPQGTTNSKSPVSMGDQRNAATVKKYQMLVDILYDFHKQGISKPLRTTIADALVKTDRDVYQRAGVDRFRDYCVIAESDGVIVLGTVNTSAWMSLHSGLLSFLGSYQNAEAVTFTGSTSGPSESAHGATTNVQPHFRVLLDVLLDYESRDIPKPYISKLVYKLENRDRSVFKNAGVEDFAQYIQLAVERGLINRGGTGYGTWIQLKDGVV